MSKAMAKAGTPRLPCGNSLEMCSIQADDALVRQPAQAFRLVTPHPVDQELARGATDDRNVQKALEEAPSP